MSFTPISNTPPQYEESGIAASGYYIKFYVAGTTTPTAMATDSTGTTLLDKCQLNTEGYPINGSGAVFIPHINVEYKIALFRNAADANANDLNSAAWTVDTLIPGLSGVVGTAFDQIPLNADIVYPVANVAALRALTGISVGQQFHLDGHTVAGIGGGTLLATKIHGSETDDNGALFVVDGVVIERPEAGELSMAEFGVLESLPDNGVIIQSMIDRIVNKSIANGSNLGVDEIVGEAGVYPCTTGITTKPWIKFRSKGNVVLDYGLAATSVTALRIDNEGEINGDLKNASSNGDIFNGSFVLEGPGQSGTSVGVDLGNSVAGTANANFRDAGLGTIIVQSFSEILKVRGFDTYLVNFQNFRLELGGANAINFPDSSGQNSGERMMFINGTIAGALNAVLLNDLGTELIFMGCSFDFCGNSVLDVTDLAGFQSVSFIGSHFENSSDMFLMRGPSTDRRLAVNISSSTVLPKNEDTSLPLTRSDGLSVPRIALFQGHMNLSINGLQFNGYNKTLNTAESGLFMCDDSVVLSNADNITFTGSSQSVSKSKIINNNWDFDDSLVGAVIEDVRDAGFYCYSRSNGIDSAIVNTNTFDGSAAALQLNSTFALTEQFTLATEPALIQSNTVGSNVVLRGGTTTGLVTTQITTRYFREGAGSSGILTGLTRSGTTATATLAGHGLKAGQTIRLSGVVETEWNNVFTINSVPTADTFTFNALTTYNGTPTGTFNYETVNSLVPISDGETKSYNYSEGYGDTDDPSFTGDRLYYARYKFPHREQKPIGATHASLVVRFTQIDVGDAVIIGGVYID